MIGSRRLFPGGSTPQTPILSGLLPTPPRACLLKTRAPRRVGGRWLHRVGNSTVGGIVVATQFLRPNRKILHTAKPPPRGAFPLRFAAGNSGILFVAPPK
jgi:hypothetical protein